MSYYTRLASTDEQEEAVKIVERAVLKSGRKMVAGITIGIHPQSIIIDLTYQGSEITVHSDGEICFFYNNEDRVMETEEDLIAMIKRYFIKEV